MKTIRNFGGYGRHTVSDFASGRKFYIEPIIPNTKYSGNWGDQNHVTGKLTGDYNGKSRGGVTEEESLITEANGFKNIRVVKGSPYSEIEKMLAE